MCKKALGAASYTLKGGCVSLNEAGVAHNAEYERVRAARRRLEATFAGAVFALVFKTNPWLDSFNLSLSADNAYDDAGRYYRSIGVGISEVRRRHGAALPEALTQTGNGAIDETTAEDWLERGIQDDAGEIYSGFAVSEECYETLHFEIRRAALGDLLEQDSLDGREAFIRLFPQQRSLVEATPDG